MTKMQSIKTERLLLRQWLPDDIDPFAEICADPLVMRYIADGSVRTRSQTIAAIERMQTHWQENGFGLFAVERRKDARLIGFTGLSVPTFLPEILPAVEIGWRLARSCWGKGYATEAAMAVLTAAQDDCKLESVVSICQSKNSASEKIMQKIGMELDRKTTEPTHGLPVLVYRKRFS